MNVLGGGLKAQDREKQVAARAAAELVESGNIVGLGSGSTATCAIRFLGDRVRNGLKIVGIPTSQNTKHLAEQLGIPLATLHQPPQIDIYIDPPPQTHPHLNPTTPGPAPLLP